MDPLSSVLGPKVSGTRVVPIVTKIVLLFTVFLLASNFASNFINLTMNRGELTRLQNRLLVKDLAELYGFASNQYEIFHFNGSLPDAVKGLTNSAASNLEGVHSAALGVKSDGSILFWASKDPMPPTFSDLASLKEMEASGASSAKEGKTWFKLGGHAFFGVYKYSDKWDAFLIRAEEEQEFNAQTQAIFAKVTGVIIAMTIICILVGALLLRRILRYVGRITQSIMKMQGDAKLTLVDLGDAPNDEVTYLGASFNALSSSIDNLMSIFRRFVTEDIAQRAYKEREIRLEGTTKQLTILFSDIKGFTFMTETLGNDIIDVLNLHYQRAISRIHDRNGIVGSIIGDALLAVFGTMGEADSKSLDSIRAAYQIQEVAAELRKTLGVEREKVLKRRGALTDQEERVYKAVLVEVGVGIDGGEVFYGNIGSYERMANTVIGDNVNSASRLEGLTRIYHVPVICSEYVKTEVEGRTNEYRFLEIDLVQVKGKTEGKRIYWPVRDELVDDQLEAEMKAFSAGLAAYYAGDWPKAAGHWKEVRLPLVEVFRDRISGGETPRNWNGIWAMTTK